MKTYIEWLLKHAKLVILVVIAVIALLVSQIHKFELDASSDSLVLENDADLRYYQSIAAHYGSSDYLIISYTPKNEQDLLSDPILKRIADLSAQLEQLPSVSGVTSILNVPLFRSPPIDLAKLKDVSVSIENNNADKAMARQEFITSPIYGNNLVSLDGKTTAILISLKSDANFIKLRRQRDDLRLKASHTDLTVAEQTQLNNLEAQVSNQTKQINDLQAQTISQIRSIMDDYRQDNIIFLGGLPMIVADVIDYIQNDLWVFTISIVLAMALTLGIIFRRWRWVIIPITISLMVAIAMTGLLSMLGWKVTVVSSNYFSMLLVMTLSIIIHLIVRYRELNEHSQDAHKTLRDTIISMARPCLFTTLTTLIAFISLLASGIRPVIDFGLMMAVGVSVALILSFVIFPLAIQWLPHKANRHFQTQSSLSGLMAKFTDKRPKTLLVISSVFVIIAVGGSFNLTVDNRFIDYFKSDTEIYQGLNDIDNRLGGTTPLEIIIDDVASDYWFDDMLRDDINHIHRYLDSLDETGKVLSIDTLIQLLATINDGKPLNNFFLNIARNNIPQDAAEQVINPYISEKTEQIRIVTRILETNPSLEREVFLQHVKDYIVNEVGFQPDSVHLTGMVVLFNNMLQSLFDSQIKTISIVFLMIFIMFIIVFRSLYLALITIVPNMLPAFFILGTMGMLGIPLDLMTITIAAIAIGIGVDDAIHYVHRYKKEFSIDGDYVQSMYRTHQSTGLAMFYTTCVVSMGFLTLVLSNFIPSIYFGIFTSIAMVTALLANLTLLPRLLIWLKPPIK